VHGGGASVDGVDLVDKVDGSGARHGGFSSSARTIGRRRRLFAQAGGAAVDQEHG
jgi:hypothetical protein